MPAPTPSPSRSLSLFVSAEDGGRIALDLDGDALLVPSPLVHVVVDRRRRQDLIDVTRSEDGGTVTIDGLLESTTVRARWSAVPIAGEPVWELRLVLLNEGDTAVAVRRMDPFAARLGGAVWDTLAFRSAWGDEFRPETDTSDHDLRIETRSGRSSHGWSPWLGLERRGAGLVVAPAWSGNWHVDVTERSTVTAGISDWQFEAVLQPGDEVTAPSVVLAAGADRDAAARALTRAVGRDWAPRSPASDRLDVEWNHWWPYEDAEIDEETFWANTAAATDLGVEMSTVDAGWFGPADAGSLWPRVRGDWSQVNTARFPSGLRGLGDGIRERGARAGIWEEAEAVGRDAELRRERPEVLALAVDGRPPDRSYGIGTEGLDPDDPTFLGYVCMGSPAGRDFVADSLERTVADFGAEWVKLDFNVDPDAGCTRTDHGHGAQDGLLRHYEGLYAVLDEFRARHPETVLEACSSGGLRIDLGLARHVHTLFLSDPDYTEHALQVLWGASLLLPPASILHWSWSQWRGDYPPARLDFATLTPHEFATTLRAAMLHRFGMSLRLVELGEEHRGVVREHVRVYRELVAPLVRLGELRRLTGQPQRAGRGERAPAFQLSSGGRHLVAQFRLDGADGPVVARPADVDPAVRYRVTDPFGGPSTEVDGAAVLRDGLSFEDRPGRFASGFRMLEPVADQEGPRA